MGNWAAQLRLLLGIEQVHMFWTWLLQCRLGAEELVMKEFMMLN